MNHKAKLLTAALALGAMGSDIPTSYPSKTGQKRQTTLQGPEHKKRAKKNRAARRSRAKNRKKK